VPVYNWVIAMMYPNQNKIRKGCDYMNSYVVIIRSSIKVISNTLTAFVIAMKKMNTEENIDKSISEMDVEKLPDVEEEVIKTNTVVKRVLYKGAIAITAFLITMYFPLELLLVAELIALYQLIDYIIGKVVVFQ